MSQTMTRSPLAEHYYVPHRTFTIAFNVRIQCGEHQRKRVQLRPTIGAPHGGYGPRRRVDTSLSARHRDVCVWRVVSRPTSLRGRVRQPLRSTTKTIKSPAMAACSTGASLPLPGASKSTTDENKTSLPTQPFLQVSANENKLPQCQPSSKVFSYPSLCSFSHRRTRRLGLRVAGRCRSRTLHPTTTEPATPLPTRGFRHATCPSPAQDEEARATSDREPGARPLRTSQTGATAQ